MITCPTCRNLIKVDCAYCPSCGARLVSTPDESPTGFPEPGSDSERVVEIPDIATMPPPERPTTPSGASRGPWSVSGAGPSHLEPGAVLAGALPDRRPARARRHGRGLPRRRPQARPAGRAEVPARERCERDRAGSTRFLDEVRIARQVSHPNVCRVYDIGEADGQHFLSMEYVDGEDLAVAAAAHRPPAGRQGARDRAAALRRARPRRTTRACSTAT